MKRIVVLVLATGTLAASGSAARESARQVTFRVVSPPANLGLTPACPDGATQGPIVSTEGPRIGTSRICVLQASKLDKPGYLIAAVLERVVETETLHGGTIVSRASYTYRFNRTATRSQMTMSGRVVGGTGRYRRARGTISGSGPTRIGAQQHPRYAYVIRLR